MLERLIVLQTLATPDYLPENIAEHLRALDSEEAVRVAATDTASALWWFVGPISFALFGKEGHQLADVDLRSTVAVLPPPFVGDENRAVQEIRALGCLVSSRQIVFTPLFVALLYGGYPWYDAYVRACDSLAVFGRNATVLDIELPDNMTAAMFNRESERIRTLLSPEICIRMEDLPFPGLIRPIHSPETIEVARHVRATRV